MVHALGVGDRMSIRIPGKHILDKRLMMASEHIDLQ
jgi:hypothetical protein